MTLDPIRCRENKYTFTVDRVGNVHIQRYDLVDWVVIASGATAIGSLLYEIEELRANVPQKELERVLAELREKHEQNQNLLKMLNGDLDECFAGGATMRKCRICSDIVVGGPNAHPGCIKLENLANRVLVLTKHRDVDCTSTRCAKCLAQDLIKEFK